jgi:hypothetical protein
VKGRATYRRVTRSINVRASTYEKLAKLANANNEHLSTTLDGIITAYLDHPDRIKT